MEVSVDRTTEVLTKAQAEVQRTLTDLEKAKAKVLRAKEAETRALAVEDEIRTRRDGVSSTLATLGAQARSVDPGNIDALNRLATDRGFLQTQLDAFDGATERATIESATARAFLAASQAALARAEEAQRSAQEKHEQAQALAEEARLVAALDPSALARKEKRERAEAVLADHLRIVRSHGAFAPGGGPCEATIEAEKVRTRHSTRQPLDANTVGWGTHSEARNVSPVGPRGTQEETQHSGNKPYNTNDPLANE